MAFTEQGVAMIANFLDPTPAFLKRPLKIITGKSLNPNPIKFNFFLFQVANLLPRPLLFSHLLG